MFESMLSGLSHPTNVSGFIQTNLGGGNTMVVTPTTGMMGEMHEIQEKEQESESKE